MIDLKEILTEIHITASWENVRHTTNFECMGLCHISATNALSFLDAEKYIKNIGSVDNLFLITEDIAKSHPEISGVVVLDPRYVFYSVHNHLTGDPRYTRRSFNSIKGKNCNISPLAYISEQNVLIGDNAIIEEFVSIKENTEIRDNVLIRAGSVIGGEGFEYKRNQKGILGVKHLGGVLIHDNVEIGCNTCIDKAIFPSDNTILGDDCKIDNLVHVGHACKVGSGTLITAGVILGGRVITGENVWLGINATVRNGITIGERAEISMGAVVTKDVHAGSRVTGNFAIAHEQFLHNLKSEINQSVE